MQRFESLRKKRLEWLKISDSEWLQMQRYRVTGNAAVQVPEKAAVGVAEKISDSEWLEMQQFKSLRKQRLEWLKNQRLRVAADAAV